MNGNFFIISVDVKFPLGGVPIPVRDMKKGGPLAELFAKLDRSRALRQKNQKAPNRVSNKLRSKRFLYSSITFDILVVLWEREFSLLLDDTFFTMATLKAFAMWLKWCNFSFQGRRIL